MLALMYRVIEQIDGERFIHLMPYRWATMVKLWILDRLDMAESLHRRHIRVLVSFILVFCLLDVTVPFISALPECGQAKSGNAPFNDIFENAVNQTGIVRAAGLVSQNGIIRVVSNNKVRALGALEAKGDKVQVSSEDFIGVSTELRTTGDTEIKTDDDMSLDSGTTALTMKKLEIVY